MISRASPRRQTAAAVLGPSVVVYGADLEVLEWALQEAQRRAKPPAGFAALIGAVTVAVEAERRRRHALPAVVRRPLVVVPPDDEGDNFVVDAIGTAEAGELLGKSARTVVRYAEGGKLTPARRRAGRWEVSRAAVVQLAVDLAKVGR